MKPFWRKLAVVGIIWAILMPAIIFFRELSDSRSMELHVMAQNLHVLVPKEPATDKSVVNLPVEGVSNWASTLHDLAVRNDSDIAMLGAVIMISSVAIIILSICILKTKRDERPAA
jgi:hypothetical protein